MVKKKKLEEIEIKLSADLYKKLCDIEKLSGVNINGIINVILAVMMIKDSEK